MKTCNGKPCYDKRTAETARNRRLRGQKAPDYLRIYHCPKCNHWHLTSRKG